MKLALTKPFTSWTHRLTRFVVRPLVGTPVSPNHLTTLRLLTGLGACIAFAMHGEEWTGAVLWTLSCLLDRADGELARLSGKSSRWGHLYDYYTDVAVNGLLFVAIGIGLRGDQFLGFWNFPLGILAGVTIVIASILSEILEKQGSTGDDKAYAGVLGFDFDDMLYLIAVFAVLGWFPYILLGAAVVGPVLALLTAGRLISTRLRKT